MCNNRLLVQCDDLELALQLAAPASAGRISAALDDTTRESSLRLRIAERRRQSRRAADESRNEGGRRRLGAPRRGRARSTHTTTLRPRGCRGRS